MPDAPQLSDDPLARARADMEGVVDPHVFYSVLDQTINHASNVCPADAAAQPWAPLGPRNIGGRIRVIAQDPRNPDILYAGSGFGGVWKTEDGGDTWRPLDDFRPAGSPTPVHRALPVGHIAIAPSNSQILYVGTGEPTTLPGDDRVEYPGSGLYRSADSGATFERIDDPGAVAPAIGAMRYERIQVDPWVADRCWIACPQGLFRREAGGAITQDVIIGPTTQDASDVIVDWGGRNLAAAPATYTVYAAIRTQGIYRNTYRTASHDYAGPWQKLSEGLGETNFNRVKIALCASRPQTLYAVFGIHDDLTSRVYRSLDGGSHWEGTSERPGDTGNQAYYDLVLEVHPDQPGILFTGSVELFRSMDGGDNWTKVIDWTKYDSGNDRAQHADQHAFVFDIGDPRKIWVGNDGGISMSRDLGNTWRKRSHGILAAQFYDVTVHPDYPFMTGGGLQDNGTWVGFGGLTWYRLFGADGGAMAFEPGDAQTFWATWQGDLGNDNDVYGVVRCTVANTRESGGGDFENLSPLPDRSTGIPMMKFQPVPGYLIDGFEAGHHAVFAGPMEHHPRNADTVVVGRRGAAYRTTDGVTFSKFNIAGIGAATDVTAVAYAPSAADTDIWIGTAAGHVYHSGDNGVSFHDRTPAGTIGYITDIAVNPRDPDIVAFSSSQASPRIFLSADRGLHWNDITGGPGSPTVVAPAAADRFAPSPCLCLAFHPQSPSGAATDQILFGGAVAGIFVIRNARGGGPALPGGWTPVWRSFNSNLPLVLIYDIVAFTTRDGAGVDRHMLRCATLGRGMYECNLGGAPHVRLLIRDHAIDDGYTYAAPVTGLPLTDDPRVVPATPLVYDKAIDIRVDSGDYQFFEDVLDGVEFDEELLSRNVIVGERNLIYVQVRNTGSAEAANVGVHLYWANPVAGAPPDLPAGFWGSLAGDPPAGPWSRVAPFQTRTLAPGQPLVLRFEWVAPGNVANPVCLLACCSHLDDDISAPAPSLVVNPATAGNVVAADRRVALRVADAVPLTDAVFVRDSVSDEGSSGAVAWGGRSTDIIVRQGPEAQPETAFADLADTRAADKVTGAGPNHVFVRVQNRREIEISGVTVDLYCFPYAKLLTPAQWDRVATLNVDPIPPRSWKFAASHQLDAPHSADPDTAGEHPYKVWFLVAIIGRPGESAPDPVAGITDITSFWNFFLRAPTSNNASLRAVRWAP